MVRESSGEDFYCDEVLSGRRPVEVIGENSMYLAFKHTRPAYSAAHIVVVPKVHVDSLLSDAEDLAVVEMVQLLRQVAGDVFTAYGAARVVTNLGSYQESKHLHWHVVAGERIPEPVEVVPGPRAGTWSSG